VRRFRRLLAGADVAAWKLEEEDLQLMEELGALLREEAALLAMEEEQAPGGGAAGHTEL
jgi:hypothetical protein